MRYPVPRNRARGLADLDQGSPVMDTPADGFTLNAHLRYLPHRAFPLFLSQLDELRINRDNYRMRTLCLPFDYETIIESFGNFDAGQNVYPGTCVWGLSFSAFDGDEADFEVQIYDVCSGMSYFSEPVQGNLLRPLGTAAGTTNLYPVLIEPRLVSGMPHPQLKVNITNKSATDQRCQLCIYTAEPCSVMGPGYGPAVKLPWQARGVYFPPEPINSGV